MKSKKSANFPLYIYLMFGISFLPTVHSYPYVHGGIRERDIAGGKGLSSTPLSVMD
jgi:hypothetical protein